MNKAFNIFYLKTIISEKNLWTFSASTYTVL